VLGKRSVTADLEEARRLIGKNLRKIEHLAA